MDGYFELFLQTTTREERLKLLRDWYGRVKMAKTAKGQAARDKVKAKSKAKASEMAAAKKEAIKKKRGR